MPLFRTAWLLPISQPPIRDAWIRTDRGRIIAFGPIASGGFTASESTDLGHVAVIPGLVNAHTHLELSWLRERVSPTSDFVDWIRTVVSWIYRTAQHRDEARRAISAAIDEAQRFGTAAVGDISNDLVSSGPLAERRMPAIVFHELIDFQSKTAQDTLARGVKKIASVASAPDLKHSLAPHAPYSVSPELFGSIHREIHRDPAARSSVHLGESRAEIQFLKDGTGPWRTFLEDVKAWDPQWVPPRCGPAEYLDRLGVLDDRLLVIHGVQFQTGDLERLAAKGATLVTCPRGNIRTGAGTPPIEAFFNHGVNVALGTDSLASVPDLNLFAELAELRKLAPAVPARALLESATLIGARALGFDSELGSIEPGKRDRLLAVNLTNDVADAEEYLVSGIDASRIRWLTPDPS